MVSTQIREQFASIRDVRLFFLHQSVGDDLIRGLERLAEEFNVRPPRFLEIGRSRIPAVGGIFAHERGGRNHEPKTKIDAFVETLRTRHELKPQFAFLKLCFVDITPYSNDDLILHYYCEQMDALRREYPQVTFVHFTVPLVARPTSFKSRLKRVLGRDDWEDASNAKRTAYNENLRLAFAGDPVFDLAELQSTRPDGSREQFGWRHGHARCMHRRYTQDGGHLNELGARAAAVRFVEFLADLAARTAESHSPAVSNCAAS